MQCYSSCYLFDRLKKVRLGHSQNYYIAGRISRFLDRSVGTRRHRRRILEFSSFISIQVTAFAILVSTTRKEHLKYYLFDAFLTHRRIVRCADGVKLNDTILYISLLQDQQLVLPFRLPTRASNATRRNRVFRHAIVIWSTFILLGCIRFN